MHDTSIECMARGNGAGKFVVLNPLLRAGLVVATHGRHCVVQEASELGHIEPHAPVRICHFRGKKNTALVGDWVRWQASADEGSIEGVEPRRNVFFRQDEMRTKAFAANIDQILILLAADPEYSPMQLARALVAAQAEQIPTLIVLNKSDLTTSFARAWNSLLEYERMSYKLLPLCLLEGDGTLNAQTTATQFESLQAELKGRVTLILGPSGTGKSSLVNALVPSAAVEVGEISQALNSGKHTTTSTRWYWLDTLNDGAVIDSPGFQEFGLNHIAAPDLAALMRDFQPYLGQCRFYNCTHLHEPGCAVTQSMESGQATLSPLRYKIYESLFAELSAAPRY